MCNFLKNWQSKQQSGTISQGLNFLSGPGERGLFYFLSLAPLVLYNCFPESQECSGLVSLQCLPIIGALTKPLMGWLAPWGPTCFQGISTSFLRVPLFPNIELLAASLSGEQNESPFRVGRF